MTTTLLAFDLIAPMIGGVLLTGAFGFVGGILMAQKKPEKLSPKIADRHESGWEAELKKLKRKQINDQFENDLVEEFVRQKNPRSSLEGLANQILAKSTARFLAIVPLTKGDDQPVVPELIGSKFLKRLVIPNHLLDQLSSENPLVVRSENGAAKLFDQLDFAVRGVIDQLYLTGIKHDGDLLAVMITSAPWPAELAKDEQHRFMSRTANRIGAQWHQMHLMEQTTRELQSARDMLELRRIIDSQSDEPMEALQRFTTRLAEMAKADRVALYFVARRAGEKAQPIVQCGRSLPTGVDSAWYQHEQALAQIAIDSELGSLNDEDWIRNLRPDSLISSALSLPIRVNGRVLGALCVTRQDCGESLEVRRNIVEFSAEILSQTLYRVCDDASIRRQARHDHLTDLVNRRSFDAYLEAEIELVLHGEANACSLILADLDHFKSYNDRYGHQVGDQVLRETAKVLAEQVSNLRLGENSIVARYGGEEFAILLPNVGAAGAMRIAERIRVAIEAKIVRIPNASLNVTISLGIAECPNQADSAEGLVEAADKALYRAKALGRNRVCLGTAND